MRFIMVAPLAYCRALGTRSQWLSTMDLCFTLTSGVVNARNPRLNVE